MKEVAGEAEWLREQRAQRGWTAADVAKIAMEQADRAGFPLKLTQQAVSAFENGKLKTIPGWLGWVRNAVGGSQAEAPRSGAQAIQMTVLLPSEDALTTMFRAMLRILPEDATEDERAQILARRLPAALSQLRDLAP
jgi:hypothetical protein